MRKLKISNKKILLKLMFRLRNIEEFKKIEFGFERNGYKVEEYGEIDRREFKIQDIEEKINEVRKKHGFNCKIVLVSNIKDVLFKSFFEYNSIIDKFIFFIDKINYNLTGEKEEIIFREGENLRKIEEKIYTNIEFTNFMPLFEFFNSNNNFKYFENIEKFDFSLSIDEKIKKNIDRLDVILNKKKEIYI